MGLLDRAKNRGQSAEITVEGAEYKTDVDKVYFEVKKEKDISLSTLSRRLNIVKEKIEEYADILDSQGLLDLYYTGLGTPRLRMKEVKKKISLKKENRIKKIIILASVLSVTLIVLIVYLRFFR